MRSWSTRANTRQRWTRCEARASTSFSKRTGATARSMVRVSISGIPMERRWKSSIARTIPHKRNRPAASVQLADFLHGRDEPFAVRFDVGGKLGGIQVGRRAARILENPDDLG